MSGTALDHPLVRGYLRELDRALAVLPSAQAAELTEQITAHLDDALTPDTGDEEIAAALSRLGLPADLAAEAASAGSSATRTAAATRTCAATRKSTTPSRQATSTLASSSEKPAWRSAGIR
ncbi:MAG: HAAS signaling domain-containing protein [Streptosporangiaceae bacterium]